MEKAIPSAIHLTPSNTTATGSKPLTSTVHHGPKLQQKSVMVLDSSIVKHVGGRNIHEYSGYKTKVCCFPGAGNKKLADHTEVELNYAKPEVAILHVGGIDLANNIEIDEIA